MPAGQDAFTLTRSEPAARDPGEVIPRELARSLWRLVRAAELCPNLEVPVDLERAYLAAHAWSTLQRIGARRNASAPGECPCVSLRLLRQVAVRHAACAHRALRRHVGALSAARGLEPDARRALARLQPLLDAHAHVLDLALHLIGLAAESDADGSVPRRK